MAKRRGFLVLPPFAAVLAVLAYWMLFTTFMSHDDEGYVLVTLKNYCIHGGLYSKVYSQYGPFFYFIHDLGHRLFRYEFTNTTGRLITLIFWVGATMACAHLVWRQTRAITLALFTAGLTFFHLWLMVSEPMHPGGLIAALVAAGAWFGARQIERGELRKLAITAAVIGTCLSLIKVNVGLFYFAATSAWFVIQLRNSLQARIAGTTVCVLLIVLPFVLMGSELREPWARTFAAMAAIASTTMFAAAWNERQSRTDWEHARTGAWAALITGTIVIAAVCVRGTGLIEMINGILIEPLRQPGVYHFPPDWKPGTRIAGTLSLLLALWKWKKRGPVLDWVLIAVRLLLTIEFSFASLEALPFSSHSSIMSYGVPLAWAFIPRLAPKESESRPNVASWIGLLLILQYLHAYPVAGSQIAWGTFLVVPLMALGLDDTRHFIARHSQTVASASVGMVFATMGVAVTGRIGLIGWHRYTDSRPLGLPGAEDIRVPEKYASTLRVLSVNAVAQGDMLFSMPGMFSFNGWTGLPTPTLKNTTHWFSLLKPKEQEEIAAAISQGNRPVLIIQKGLLEFLSNNHFVVSGPLNDYLKENFAHILQVDQYEFLVRKRRQAVPLDMAELLQLRSPRAGMAANRLEIVVAVPAGSKVARIELATLDDRPRILMQWDKNSGSLSSTAINLQGAALAGKNIVAWETPLPPLVRLDLSIDPPPTFLRRNSVIYLRDPEGDLIAEARFME